MLMFLFHLILIRMESEDSFDDISDVSLASKLSDNKIINIKEIKKERGI